jgi:hypothetical protein
VTVGTAVQQYFIGIFLNNFFPSTVGGDMAKVYYLGRHHGYRPIAASIVFDRLLSIGLLAVLATAMYWIAPDPSPQFVTTRAIITAIAACLIGGLVLAARGTGGLPQRLSRFGTLAVGWRNGRSAFATIWPAPRGGRRSSRNQRRSSSPISSC